MLEKLKGQIKLIFNRNNFIKSLPIYFNKRTTEIMLEKLKGQRNQIKYQVRQKMIIKG